MPDGASKISKSLPTQLSMVVKFQHPPSAFAFHTVVHAVVVVMIIWGWCPSRKTSDPTRQFYGLEQTWKPHPHRWSWLLCVKITSHVRLLSAPAFSPFLWIAIASLWFAVFSNRHSEKLQPSLYAWDISSCLRHNTSSPQAMILWS